MTSAWDDIPEDVTQGGTSDWPVIADDVYDAVIVEVGDPYDKETQYGARKKFTLTWELSGGELDEPVQIPQFVSIPPKFIENGFLSDKANLFILMKALGFDMDGAIKVQPPTWKGKRARLATEISQNADGTQTTWITKVMPPRQRRAQPQPVAAAGRVVAAAGARRGAAGWDIPDDDNEPFE